MGYLQNAPAHRAHWRVPDVVDLPCVTGKPIVYTPPRPVVVNEDLCKTLSVVLDPDELVVRGETIDEFICSICMG